MLRRLLCLALLHPLVLLPELRAAEALEAEFAAPPLESRPLAWWHWMNGSVTQESIRAELEDMKRVGLAGVQLLDVTPGFTRETLFPAGPVRWGSDAWHEHVQYAIRTAAELGLKFGLHNCAGWSESGGPWVTPDDSMKKVVWSETGVEGGVLVRARLPVPPSHLDYYRDIAVLAVPADPEPETIAPIVTSSVAGAPVDRLVDGRVEGDGFVSFPKGTENLRLTFSFPAPVERRLLVITAPYQRGAEVRLGGDLEVSEDGATFRKVRSFGFPGGLFAHKGYLGSDLVLNVPFAPVRARVFRVAFQGALNPLTLAEVTLSRSYRIENFQSKTLTSPLGSLLPPANAPRRDSAAIPVGRVVDLTAALQPDGSLAWQAPAGRWTLLRLGYTTTGLPNHPAQDEGTGLEVDKMSRPALQRHWQAALGRILREAGPHAGRAFNSVLTDSWEAAQQNWTADFSREFRARRGYELRSWLPVLTGRVVGSLADAEGFLGDFRRTCGDLIAVNYFGEMRRLAEEHGLLYYGEAYGGKTFNEGQAGLNVGVNMAEFWFTRDRTKFNVGGVKARASLAHVRGRPLMAAESFTATQGEAGWAASPAYLKPIGDLAFANGLTQIFLHSYVHQPYPHLMPGFTVGSSGSNFNRLNTWWPRADAWLTYLARCQHLLRQGDSVADILLVKNAGIGGFQSDRFPAVPSGYDHDEADPSVLEGAVVEAGRVRLASGASYRVLALPAVWLADLSLLERLGALAEAGALILGPPPYAPAGRLEEAAWAEWQARVARRWATGQRGSVGTSQDLAAALAEAGLAPDCRLTLPEGAAPVRYLHRRAAAADIYFLATTSDRTVRFTADFRVGGRVPELWDPVTGQCAPAPVYRTVGGRTQLDLALGDAGSVFIVFRRPAGGPHVERILGAERAPVWIGEQVVPAAAGRAWVPGGGLVRLVWSDGREQSVGMKPQPAPLAFEGGWAVSFQTPQGRTFAREFPRLQSWSEGDGELKYFSGAAVYRRTFDLAAEALPRGARVMLELGDVRDLATVTLNGRTLATLWAPPFEVDATTLLRPGRNTLEIEVRNRWVNRLMGDSRLPQDTEHQTKFAAGHSVGIIAKFPDWMHDPARLAQRQRTTFATYQTYYKPPDPLPASGLIGPVRLRFDAPLSLERRD